MAIQQSSWALARALLMTIAGICMTAFGAKELLHLGAVPQVPVASSPKPTPAPGHGGAGGKASVVGSGTAIGGKGGGAGPFGNGGKGGDAEVRGDGLAVGGEGGEAGQIDRGGRGGRSGFAQLGHPEQFYKGSGWMSQFGRGGDGGGPDHYVGLVDASKRVYTTLVHSQWGKEVDTHCETGDENLNYVARALADSGHIRARAAAAADPRLLSKEELRQGQFLYGAQQFRTPNQTEPWTDLEVLLSDVHAFIQRHRA